MSVWYVGHLPNMVEGSFEWVAFQWSKYLPSPTQKKAVQVRFKIIARTKPEVAGRSKNSNLKYGWAWIGL